MKPRKEFSSWLIVLVVLVTAFITSWAMLKFKPGRDWNSSSSYYPPQQVAQNLMPGVAAMENNWLMAAGGRRRIPAIMAGAVPPHPDRGVCTTCHTVLSSRRKPIPVISATATMPHEYRGVCSNCHQIGIQSQLAANPYAVQGAMPANPYAMQGAIPATPTPITAIPVAAVRPVVTPGTQMPLGTQTPLAAQTPLGTQIFPAAQTPARTPTEGEWMGLEVTPITLLTAQQYRIPVETRGLVVAEAEAQAATAGVKAGDVIVWLNGMPITQMTDFFQATRNGTSTQGTVGFIRQGQRFSANIAQTTTRGVAAVPNTPPNLPPAGMAGTMPPVQAGAPMAPVAAARWGGEQRFNSAATGTPSPAWQRQF